MVTGMSWWGEMSSKASDDFFVYEQMIGEVNPRLVSFCVFWVVN